MADIGTGIFGAGDAGEIVPAKLTSAGILFVQSEPPSGAAEMLIVLLAAALAHSGARNVTGPAVSTDGTAPNDVPEVVICADCVARGPAYHVESVSAETASAPLSIWLCAMGQLGCQPPSGPLQQISRTGGYSVGPPRRGSRLAQVNAVLLGRR